MTAKTATPTAFAADCPRTKAGTPLVKLALSRAKKAGLFDDVAKTTGKRVAIGLRPNASQTGSWTFQRSRAGMRHVITLDPNAHKGITHPKPRYATDEWTLSCFAAILRHECHHALHTERDLLKVNRECAAHGVPFVSLNIGEDIRIDQLAVVKHGSYNWSRWYGVNGKRQETAEPLAWLVWAKIYETPHHAALPVTWTGTAEVERVRIGKPDGKGKRKAGDVLSEFYREFQLAADTMAVIPILRDLFLTFPTAEKDITRVKGLPNGIVGHGYSGTDESEHVAHKDDVAEVPGTPAPAPELRPASYPVKPDRFMTNGYASMTDADWERLTGRSVREYVTKSRAVAERLARLLGAQGGQPERISTSGPRIHVGNAAAGRAEAFRRVGERKGTCPRVVAVFDQSGSMGPDFANHGAAFLGAMLSLSQQGVVDGHIVLTGGAKHCVLPPNFPIASVLRFKCNEGCETVRDTLDAQRKLVQSADIVLVYTDGALTDGRVDAGKWRSHGVDLIGCAVSRGPTEYYTEGLREAMSKHFHRALIAPSGEELATKIAQYIATRR